MKRFATGFGIFVLVMGLMAGGARADNSNPETPYPQVKLTTSKGDIVLELNRLKAPKTVENFLYYVKSGFFAGTIFHRVIKGFMIQGGGLTENLAKKPLPGPRSAIRNEASNKLQNRRGTIAMARTGDPHSATNQFFINTADNASLDHRGRSGRGWGYAVFGRVLTGMNVVDAIEGVRTGYRNGRGDVPQETVFITKVEVLAE